MDESVTNLGIINFVYTFLLYETDGELAKGVKDNAWDLISFHWCS